MVQWTMPRTWGLGETLSTCGRSTPQAATVDRQQGSPRGGVQAGRGAGKATGIACNVWTSLVCWVSNHKVSLSGKTPAKSCRSGLIETFRLRKLRAGRLESGV